MIGNTKFHRINSKTSLIKEKISNFYIEAQNTIIKDFFNSLFDRIESIQELEAFRCKLKDFSKLLGLTDNYTFYDEFYTETMNKLEHKYSVIENSGIETALNVPHKNIFRALFEKLFNLITAKTKRTS